MAVHSDFSHRRSLAFFLCIAALFAAALAGCSNPEKPKGEPPAAEVVVLTVQPRTLPAVVSFVAQIQSSHQVDITARVSGFLEKILYDEGRPVSEGQILFQIDKKPFLAAVDAVKAEVEIRESQLWTARASFNRIKPLADQNAASKSDLDNATGAVKSAEAALQQAKANLDKANLDLGYTTITSPVSGLAGQSKIREGVYIAAGSPSATLTYVAKLDPAWVEFSMSQNEESDVIQEEASGRLVPPKGNRYTIELELSGGRRYPQIGVVNFSDPSFSKTGTFLVRAEIPNPKGELRPGMFVKAYLIGETRPNALAVPQKSVQQTANGHVIYIANAKDQVEVRPVTVGDWVGHDWIIKQGLKAGERVIVDGFMKLEPGMKVLPVSPEQQRAAQASKPAAGL
ncbi:MAG: efflux RND transporter periplasmic adaptor subunit [Acidobacteria bacterium]|jgi:membrane fusion protein (multidrug efflux system)|nr:efflux RND transporter periplasmic adaptor subunit [Acidobacteriota bacterium]